MSANARELTLTRLFNARPDQVFKAWTDPELLKEWFTPRPWTVSRVESDVRSGGSSLVVMRSPEGQEFPQRGVYLEVIPNEKLVFTDAYVDSWQPSDKPFMTAVVTFVNENGKTRYTARALHWSEADRETHEKMGFHEGWGRAADQLEALLARIV
jgi:uncharacterized protein YndB with AHSA1/START domain